MTVKHGETWIGPEEVARDREEPLYLYWAALNADEAFSVELARVYGRKSQDARYQTAAFADPKVQAAFRAKVKADTAWLKVMRQASLARSRTVSK